ncbi:hypothetical protein DSECCO2_642620 [anaerobic digester metagenome]
MTDDRREFDELERILLGDAYDACHQKDCSCYGGNVEPHDDNRKTRQVGHQRNGVEGPDHDDDPPHRPEPSGVGDCRLGRMLPMVELPGIDHAEDAPERDVQDTDPDRKDHELGYLGAVTARGNPYVEVPGEEQRRPWERSPEEFAVEYAEYDA